MNQEIMSELFGTSEQIADLADSYVVSDDVENTIGNKLPLWLFGFLY